MLWGADLPETPAYGEEGWLQFGLCSYLLGQNEWTTFGWVFEQESDQVPRLDLSISKALGIPLGTHAQYGDDPYFRYREYGPSADGGAGGVVVVNANTDSSRKFTVPFNGTDESGAFVLQGQEIEIKPNTGRILLRQKDPVLVRIHTPTDVVAPGDEVTIFVDYLNGPGETVQNFVLRAAVPPEMTYVTGSAEQSGGSYDAAGNAVTWAIGTVPAGHGGRRTFKARVR